jgi:hypothetical protein
MVLVHAFLVHDTCGCIASAPNAGNMRWFLFSCEMLCRLYSVVWMLLDLRKSLPICSKAKTLPIDKNNPEICFCITLCIWQKKKERKKTVLQDPRPIFFSVVLRLNCKLLQH